MIKNKFREKSPERTYTGNELSPYSKYKSFLAKDFNRRCGYTDCPDFWFGGKQTFHIDHFAPKSKFDGLEKKYSNLVYSCSYVNRAKSDDWPSDDSSVSIVNGEGYMDPCDIDYNDHFYRDDEGKIKPQANSEVANYMYRKLKLYLRRYSIIWKLEQIDERIKEIVKLLPGDVSDTDTKLLVVLAELTREFSKYKEYLRAEI